MSVTYLGETSAQQLASIRTYDPRSGWRITERYRGRLSEITALSAALVTSGYRLQVEPDDDGNYAVLLVDVPDAEQDVNEALADQWTLAGNDLEKSLWEHPKIAAQLAASNQTGWALYEWVAGMRLYVEAFLKGEETMTLLGQSYTVSESLMQSYVEGAAMDWSVWLGFIGAMARGAEAFSVSQYVLRRVRTVLSNTSIKPSLANVGKIYSTAQLQSTEPVPATILFDLPEGYWLKRTPTVSQVTSQKWEISEEWWHADFYESFIYDPAS